MLGTSISDKNMDSRIQQLHTLLDIGSNMRHCQHRFNGHQQWNVNFFSSSLEATTIRYIDLLPNSSQYRIDNIYYLLNGTSISDKNRDSRIQQLHTLLDIGSNMRHCQYRFNGHQQWKVKTNKRIMYLISTIFNLQMQQCIRESV